jgi:prepilin-type N-terminal cleavage/methylation domain-containing protein/prepilin-type processing-associated H-X9-DG protein
MKAKHNQSGFTLVELLVVISIIALLLAILMPALNKVREQAKIVVCKTHLKQMGAASAMYCLNNRDTLIPERTYVNWVVGQAARSDNDVVTWNKLLAVYIGSNKGAKAISENGSWQSDKGEQDKVLSTFKCPSQRDRFEFTWYLRYGLNYQFHASNLLKVPTPLYLKQSSVTRPSERLQIADSMDTWPYEGRYKNLDSATTTKRKKQESNLRFSDGTSYGIPGFWIYPSATGESPGWIYPVADRHQNGTNLLFLDGHVNYGKYKDVMIVRGEDKAARQKKIEMWDYQGSTALYNKQ